MSINALSPGLIIPCKKECNLPEPRSNPFILCFVFSKSLCISWFMVLSNPRIWEWEKHPWLLELGRLQTAKHWTFFSVQFIFAFPFYRRFQSLGEEQLNANILTHKRRIKVFMCVLSHLLIEVYIRTNGLESMENANARQANRISHWPVTDFRVRYFSMKLLTYKQVVVRD